ncbi:acetyltransferase, GNAT family protein [Planococcus donghaensis MPA1U2]|uniref:Acetyltransferase, GNAT family protein n=1 Tax=Planococcus donghaensis MPA1U2 TaxID=933115 RepID=E7RGT8_9BACL|nr:GNAT family N-acetyltransferase [Planococcus donghaensis]EGA89821.1 acetyltransferase, GNAT family protein [Planococcus donghaensis MPA1U2]
MDLLKQINELDFALLQSFSTKLDRPWGALFLNRDQPDYYDANHAYINTQPEHPKKVINEVVSFYRSHSITPRFYLDHVNSLTSFITLLKEEGFQYEDLPQSIQLWNKKVTSLSIPELVTVEKVDDTNYQDASWVECQINEFGGKAVREKAFETEFKDSRYTHFLLKVNGRPSSTACLFVHNNQGRIESVATIEKFRGQGLIGFVLQQIQIEAQAMKLENLWVHPINKQVEKVYNRYGFDTIHTLQSGHAFLDGKSIKEIRD